MMRFFYDVILHPQPNCRASTRSAVTKGQGAKGMPLKCKNSSSLFPEVQQFLDSWGVPLAPWRLKNA